MNRRKLFFFFLTVYAYFPRFGDAGNLNLVSATLCHGQPDVTLEMKTRKKILLLFRPAFLLGVGLSAGDEDDNDDLTLSFILSPSPPSAGYKEYVGRWDTVTNIQFYPSTSFYMSFSCWLFYW